MIRVAIETSTSLGTVAIAQDERVLAEVELGAQRRHAERALPALEDALGTAGVARDQIREVVVGAGPGSFTGTRVAAATAKGLVAGLGVPLRAFSSLLALVASVEADGPVCALFDARRGEVYAGCWRLGPDGTETLLDPMVGPLEIVLERLGGTTGADSPLFIGDGAERYRDLLTSAGARIAGEPSHPRAGTLLRLAAGSADEGRVDDVAGWEPMYLRASSAERGVAG